MRMCRMLGRVVLFMALLGAPLFVGCEDSGGGGGIGDGHDFGQNDPNTVSVIGDSITVWTRPTWPQILAERSGKRVVNRGVSGETSGSAPGRARQAVTADRPGYLLVQYGANDAIQGWSPEGTVENLREVVRAAKGSQTIPLLANVMPMTGYRSVFQPRIDRINELVAIMAKEEGVRIVNVAALFQNNLALLEEGLHPTLEGSGVIAGAFLDVIL